MPVPALVFRDNKLLLVDGDATTNEDCCCDDPCGCYEGFDAAILPESGTLSTPFGSLTIAKKANTVSPPYTNDCSGRCPVADGAIEYIYWGCDYTISRKYECETSACPADKTCDTTTVDPETGDTFRYLNELTGFIHFYYTIHVAFTGIDTIWSSNGSGFLRLEKRLNCETGQWQAKVTMNYRVMQYLLADWKGTERTRTYTNGTLNEDSSLEYWAGVSNFCTPFDSNNEEQLGPRWGPAFASCAPSTSGTGGGGYALISAATSWFNVASGISAAVSFPTTIGSISPPSTAYQLIDFLNPTSNLSSAFICDPLGFATADWGWDASTPSMTVTRCSATDANNTFDTHTVTF